LQIIGHNLRFRWGTSRGEPLKSRPRNVASRNYCRSITLSCGATCFSMFWTVLVVDRECNGQTEPALAVVQSNDPRWKPQPCLLQRKMEVTVMVSMVVYC